MSVKFAFGLLYVSVLVSALFLTVNVRLAGASSTVYIRPDGSVEPSTAPIERVGDVYVIIGDIYDGIYVERSNVVVNGAGHTVHGLRIEDVNNVTIQKMQITGVVFIYDSSNDRILENNITANSWTGIWLLNSNGTDVSGNNVTLCRRGIDVHGSNNTIRDNDFTGNEAGVWLEGGSNNVLRNNRMAGNRINFAVFPDYTPSSFMNDVDSSNTVDGKPVYWWINEQDMVVPSDAGFVALVNCTRITVQNLNLANNLISLYLVSTTNSTVTQSNITDNDFSSVYLIQSSNNSIFENKIANNGAAIFLISSDHNEMSRNDIANNIEGIVLSNSSYNIMSENDITGNGNGIGILFYSNSNYNYLNENEIAMKRIGIHVLDSSYNSIVENTIATSGTGMGVGGICLGNSIFHNNFLNNSAFSYPWYPQIWDDGYHSGGNYWSDYSGIDLYTGAYQNMTGSDGIGDTWMQIGDDVDRYPLMNPWRSPIQGDINKDAKVDVRDLSLAAKAFGAYSSQPVWNPIGDINQDGKIDIRDLVLIAKNFGKTQP